MKEWKPQGKKGNSKERKEMKERKEARTKERNVIAQLRNGTRK